MCFGVTNDVFVFFEDGLQGELLDRATALGFKIIPESEGIIVAGSDCLMVIFESNPSHLNHLPWIASW